MKLRLAVIMVMSQFAALAQQPLGEVTYFFGVSTSQNQSVEEPLDVPSYAEAVADKSPSETEQQRYVFFARDGHTIVYRLAQWTDPFTAPQTRTGCVLWGKFYVHPTGQAKICIDHRYEFKTLEVELILQVTVAGQGDDQNIRSGLDEVLKQSGPATAAVALVDCQVTGCGTALATAKYDFYTTLEGYIQRMGVLPSEFGIEVDTRSFWSDWK